MKKQTAILLSVILAFSCCFTLSSCSLFEGAKEPELGIGFEEYEAKTTLYDAEKQGEQSFYVYSKSADLLTGAEGKWANLTVTDKTVYTGEKAMQGKTVGAYVAKPLSLAPNTKYTLSFFYNYTTEDPDCYLSSIEYGIYSIISEGEEKGFKKASGKGTVTKEAYNPSHLADGWHKIVLEFETGDTTDNLVFAYRYFEKSKTGNKTGKTTLFVDDINLYLAESFVKSEVEIKNKTAASVELITANPQIISPDDTIEFKVVTAKGLTPEVEVNSKTLTPNEKGVYSFVAKKNTSIEVVCEGDENRRDAGVDKNGNDLTRYNAEIATVPYWQGDVVYHENVLFVPGRETAKLLYPVSEAISVRSYDLFTNYIEGLDYEITADGLLKRLEGSRIPIFTDPLETDEENGFPTADGKYLSFINDYDYVKYAISITYEHKTIWPNGEGYNPVKTDSAKEKLPRVFEKLENGEEVNIVVFGDSISCGWSSSGLNFEKQIYSKEGLVGSNVFNVPPYTPPWPEMLKAQLEKSYPNAKINLKILALGGTNSYWGAKTISERLGFLGEDWTTDLMILSFATNDIYKGIKAEEYYTYMQYIIDMFWGVSPDAEVLLWSQTLPNLNTTVYPVEAYSEYQQQLENIADANDGVALVKTTDHFMEVIKSKEAIDCLNTNVNHPNDFTTRLMAHGLIAALLP